MGNHLCACFGAAGDAGPAARCGDMEKGHEEPLRVAIGGTPKASPRKGRGAAAPGSTAEHKCIEWISTTSPGLGVMKPITPLSSSWSSSCLDPVSPLVSTRQRNGLPVEDDQEWAVGSLSQVELLQRLLAMARDSGASQEDHGAPVDPRGREFATCGHTQVAVGVGSLAGHEGFKEAEEERYESTHVGAADTDCTELDDSRHDTVKCDRCCCSRHSSASVDADLGPGDCPLQTSKTIHPTRLLLPKTTAL